MRPAHILLLDDHPMFRAGMRMVLDAALSGVTIFEAGATQEAMHSGPDEIDMVLLDVKLIGLSGLDSIALLKRKWPMATIVMLSAEDHPETVSLALTNGATAFVSKAEPAEKIIETVTLVLQGNYSQAAPVLRDDSVRRLTPRQCEVLELLHQGLSNKLIARRLSLSDNTVRRHVQGILEFFGVASRAEAVFAAHYQGQIN